MNPAGPAADEVAESSLEMGTGGASVLRSGGNKEHAHFLSVAAAVWNSGWVLAFKVRRRRLASALGDRLQTRARLAFF